MGEPKTIPTEPVGASKADSKPNPAVNRLREKAQALRGPRGKYRCRKCHELPCVCPDPKQSTPASAASAPEPLATPKPIFTEARTKRLLEAGFGIPTVITQCKLWALTEEEALELSQPAADVLNEFVSVDPKWVSLTLLSVSLGSILARKAVLYSAWKRAMMLHRVRDNPPTKTENLSTETPPANPGSDDKGPGPSVTMDMLQ